MKKLIISISFEFFNSKNIYFDIGSAKKKLFEQIMASGVLDSEMQYQKNYLCAKFFI